jgi:hypothetical protein
MSLGYNKMELFDSVVQKNFDLKETVKYLTKLSSKPFGDTTSSTTSPTTISKYGNITSNLYNMVYNNGKLFLFNNILADNSRLINVVDVKKRTSSKTMEIDNEFETKAKANSNNRYYSAHCSNAKITMIAGGCDYDGKDVSDMVSIYNHSWKVWKKAKLSKPRYMMNAIEHNDKFYFIGGLKEDDSISATIDVISADIQQPTTIKMPFKGRLNMNVEANNGKLYFIGGYDDSSYVDRIDIYDIDTKEWAAINAPNLLNSVTQIIKSGRENKNDQLFIATSSKMNNKYQHNDLITANPINTNMSLYNGVPTYKMGDLDNTNAASAAFWINIPEKYNGKTCLIMKLNNNGIALYKNQLIPCFFLDGNILIKNANGKPIEYGKWTHIVLNAVAAATAAAATAATATATTAAATATTVAATVATATTESMASHEITIYIDGHMTEYPMNFSLEYNKGLTLTGYEIIQDIDIEYPELGLVSNINVFNKHINFATITTIYHAEYNMYQRGIDYSFRSLDLKTLKITKVAAGITSRDYKNIIMQTYKDRFLIMALNYLDDDDNMTTEYYKYDPKTHTGITIKTETDNYINIAAVETENGVIMGGYRDDQYRLAFIDIDDDGISTIVNCIPGEKLVNNECVVCPADTYSTEVNSDRCVACPANTSTETKKGQSKCHTKPEFTNKSVSYPIAPNSQKILNSQFAKYNEMEKENNIDAANIAAFQNNLNLVAKAI